MFIPLSIYILVDKCVDINTKNKKSRNTSVSAVRAMVGISGFEPETS